VNNEQSKPDALSDKSYAFAIWVLGYQHLQTKKKKYVLSRQILKSGTAIRALIREAAYAQGKLDFINKMSIALKETNETEYWLNILKDTDYLEEKPFGSLFADCKGLLRLLISTTETSKGI
jgi:four helix bundle protein